MLIKGQLVYSENKYKINIVENAYVLVENGKVQDVYTELPEHLAGEELIDYGNRLIIPAFSDMHVHGSQLLQRGIGMDKELLDWLDTYTFPNEAKMKDKGYAKELYTMFVDEMIKHGTFHANVFTTIHTEASQILFDIMESRGLSGFVGKLNMDCNCPAYIGEETENSIKETEKFILQNKGGKYVKPAIVPRFTITCSERLLKGLGKLANQYDVAVHSHLCEAVNEMKVVKELFPSYKNGAEIFKQAGLLGNTKTMMAHCIFMDEDVRELMKSENAMAVHCPDATINVNAGGIMPVKELLEQEIQIGLGSDVGSGHHIGIYHVVGAAIRASKALTMYDQPYGYHLTLEEAFYMATKSGGSFFDKVGSLEKGYHFNALIIDDSNIPSFEMTALERLERFCYMGDDRNIHARYIRGKAIK